MHDCSKQATLFITMTVFALSTKKGPASCNKGTESWSPATAQRSSSGTGERTASSQGCRRSCNSQGTPHILFAPMPSIPFYSSWTFSSPFSGRKPPFECCCWSSTLLVPCSRHPYCYAYNNRKHYQHIHHYSNSFSTLLGRLHEFLLYIIYYSKKTSTEARMEE